MTGQRMRHADADFVQRSLRLGVEKIEVHRLSLSVLIGGLEGDCRRTMVNLPLSAAGRSYAGLTVIGRRGPLSLPARMPRESRRVAASSPGILRSCCGRQTTARHGACGGGARAIAGESAN